MSGSLPRFRYHPDPVATGAFEEQSQPCRCCGEARGWVYTVAPYASDNLRDQLCPWCIADGSAAERFSARFTEVTADDVPDGVDPAVVDEVVSRTPGFSAWDRERWLFHCDDAAAFLGPCGWEVLEELPTVVEQLRAEAERSGMDPDLAAAFVGSLDPDGAATAYLFRCLHCGDHLAYADADAD